MILSLKRTATQLLSRSSSSIALKYPMFNKRFRLIAQNASVELGVLLWFNKLFINPAWDSWKAPILLIPHAFWKADQLQGVVLRGIDHFLSINPSLCGGFFSKGVGKTDVLKQYWGWQGMPFGTSILNWYTRLKHTGFNIFFFFSLFKFRLLSFVLHNIHFWI